MSHSPQLAMSPQRPLKFVFNGFMLMVIIVSSAPRYIHSQLMLCLSSQIIMLLSWVV
jgi:hypothetical protein